MKRLQDVVEAVGALLLAAIVAIVLIQIVGQCGHTVTIEVTPPDSEMAAVGDFLSAQAL